MNTRPRMVGPLLLVLALAVAAASRASAGVVDSPLPVLTAGVPVKHLFTVPGVVKFKEMNTEFSCTSLESTNTFKFAVQIFAKAGGAPLNDVTTANNGTLSLGPGETGTIATGNTTALHEDQAISALAGVDVANGSARIVSESPRMTCTAYIADRHGTCTAPASSSFLGKACGTDTDCGGTVGSCRTTPDSMVSLKVIKSKTQKGD
jgi:hypothetical protein